MLLTKKFQFTARKSEIVEIKAPDSAVNLQVEVEDEVGQSLAELDVVDDVVEDGGGGPPGLYPHPPHDHLDVSVHQGPPIDLDWGLTSELGQTSPEYLVSELRSTDVQLSTTDGEKNCPGINVHCF